MSRRIHLGPQAGISALCIPIPKFDQDDPQSCQAAAEALKASVIEQITKDGVPALMAPELAQQIADAFLKSIHEGGPICGVASAEMEAASGAELLKQLTGDLDFKKEN